MSPKFKAALASFARVLMAAGGAVYLTLGKGPLELNADDWKKLAGAVISAAVLTGINWARSGETRFGVGSQDIGMGGADKLEAPDGKINPASLETVEKTFGGEQYTETVEAKPVQTDNTPKPEDGEQIATEPEPFEEFTGEMR